MKETLNNSERKKIAPVFILLSVLPGTFLSHFSAGLVNIALPNLSIYFEASVGAVQWIVTGYLLMVMLFLPIMGNLADKLGKKHIHNLGYLIFGCGIVLSALSTSLGFLIASRLLQGIGAAMLQATNMAIITENYSEEKRGRALGIISTAVGVGAMLGPSAGGLIINWFSWQMLFYIQVPIIIVSVLMAIKFIPNDKKEKQTSSLDYVGAALFGITVPSIIFVLNQIGEGQMNNTLLYIGVIGVVSFILFMVWTKKRENPFINRKLFSPPMVKAGSVIIVVSYMATFAAMVVVPFYLQGILGVSPSVSGFLLMSYPLLLAIFGPISGMLSDRLGSYLVVMVGLMFMLGALICLSLLSASSSLATVAIFLCFLGIAMGVLTSPNYNLIIDYVSIRYLGIITSTIALLRNFGMAIGTAIGVTFMNGFVDGSMTEWMMTGKEREISHVMTGFKSFFAFMALLTALTSLYLVIKEYRLQKAEKEQV
ncbi:MFS transporter [Oceanobacillus halophilus]|uniref:DHA2 family efflux MFS transporter permease subunit n=1 Tax=Oceanobacillus halophilus TaxID=930130 RepID=A0A495A371_9BACI|nr:MFS transporter [Oceanobacillus halophilus]RKQ33534.1 DHA2 family efflux MFS transporter permease subunit [Oceanobacillus halophilus]